MISDDDLFRLAIFLGSCAMLLIVIYHFLEVNAKDDTVSRESGPSSTGGDSKQILREADPVAFAPAVGTTAGGKGKGVAR